jgi:2-polyprenyl-3-methyl-5-hydroxy-6-metoxy-1,4-benzoquinol methylase
MKIDRARALYQRLYDAGRPVHPTKGELQEYGAEALRDKRMIGFLADRILPPASVFDASCGRAHLLRELRALGYYVEGSEIVRTPEHDEFIIHDLAYQELQSLPAYSFDVVVSSDVLEHLPPSDIRVAIPNLVRLVKRRGIMVISVGIRAARNWPDAITDLGISDLHLTKRDPGWWIDEFSAFIDVEDSCTARRNVYLVGRVP